MVPYTKHKSPSAHRIGGSAVSCLGGSVAAVIIALTAAAPAAAVSKSWTTGNGSWSTAGNWSPAGAPAAGDAALIGTNAGAANAVVTLNVNATIDSLTLVDGMTLRAIAAAVIGGCSLAGGRGSILAGLLGLVLMAVLTNASVLLHVSPYWQKALIGGILLAAIASERIGRHTNNGSV
jgi:hypothetical protein